MLHRFCGLDIGIKVRRRGFFPQGGGELTATVGPARPGATGKPLKPIVLGRRGAVTSIAGVACVGGGVLAAEAEAMVGAATAALRAGLGAAEATAAGSAAGAAAGVAEVPIDIAVDVDDSSHSSGGGLTLWATTDSGSILAGSALLELPRASHKRPRGGGGRGGGKATPLGVGLGADVGTAAAESLLKELRTGGAVDEHLADQLVVFMALAAGRSSVLTGPLSLHTRTAIHFATALTGAKMMVEDLAQDPPGRHVIRCEGMGFLNGAGS